MSSCLIFGASTWKVNGISTNGGLMIIYKSMAPLILDVEAGEKKMLITKEQKNFTYSKMAGKHPIKVIARAEYNPDIVGQGGNELNKNIINTIYNRVSFEFPQPDFKLNYIPKNGEEAKPDKYIDGKAYFTDKNGVQNLGTKQESNLINNIVSGKLTTSEVYVDAQFTVPNNVNLLGGETYRGSVRITAEALGQNLQQ